MKHLNFCCTIVHQQYVNNNNDLKQEYRLDYETFESIMVF